MLRCVAVTVGDFPAPRALTEIQNKSSCDHERTYSSLKSTLLILIVVNLTTDDLNTTYGARLCHDVDS